MDLLLHPWVFKASAHSIFNESPFLLTQGPAGLEISSGGDYLRSRGLEIGKGGDIDGLGRGDLALRDKVGLVDGLPHL